ncbi:MAG: hypothetical protein AAFZ18_04910 [Myxococcota bacterium]
MSEQRVELDPHPIRDVVAQLLKDGTDEKALFDDDAQKKLSSVVDDYVAQNDHELQPVVRTLIAIFEWLRDDERSPRAAEALKSTFKRPEVIARVEAIEAEMRSQESESRRSEAEQNAQIFGRMAGRSSQVAPQVGALAPAGSLKLGHLNFPKKL